MLDAIIEGSIVFGFGYVITMFAGFFVRTVAPAPKCDGLSEVAGKDLVQQSTAIPPAMEYVDIFADEDLIDDAAWEYGEDPSPDEELPAFPGDVTETADEDAIDLGAEFAAVAAYWTCGLRTVQLSVDEVALVEAALAA